MEKSFDNCCSQEQVDKLLYTYIDNWKEYSLEERKKVVEEYSEAYWRVAGVNPPAYKLDTLADFILAEELANAHPDKVARTEYPILTEAQMLRRYKKTVLYGEEHVSDYLNARYNSWKCEGGTNVHKRITTEKRD